MIISISIDDLPKKESPPCLSCGGKTYSNGATWRCEECGRQRVKVTSTKNMDWESRPCCPSCGVQKTIYGPSGRWQCSVCSTSWKRNYARKL